MKTNGRVILIFAGLLVILSACTKIFINEISKSPNLKFLESSKTVLVVGTDGVALNEFIKTFNNRYKQKRDFINEYINSFGGKLSEGRVFTNVKSDTSTCWSLIKSFAGAKEDFNVIDSLFQRCSSDYILNISNFEVKNYTRTTTSSRPAYGGSGGTVMTSSSTEFCVVLAQFQFIDKKTRKNLMEFRSTGESSVFLFAYDLALENAIKSSIDHAIAYLKTGQIEFRR
jgi:hypothetical protein